MTKLEAYTWPGGYTLYYLTEECDVLCSVCATGAVVTQCVNYEDDTLHCDECHKHLEASYS